MANFVHLCLVFSWWESGWVYFFITNASEVKTWGMLGWQIVSWSLKYKEWRRYSLFSLGFSYGLSFYKSNRVRACHCCIGLYRSVLFYCLYHFSSNFWASGRFLSFTKWFSCLIHKWIAFTSSKSIISFLTSLQCPLIFTHCRAISWWLVVFRATSGCRF